MHLLGLHLRFENSLVDLANKAKDLGLDFFQFFLTLKTEGKLLSFEERDIQDFLKIRRENFSHLYMHVSYWVNPSSVKIDEHRLLKKELAIAKKLELTHIIMHPGSSKGAKSISAGIEALARTINKLVVQEPNFTFVLENIAQGKPSVGGNIEHFASLLEKLDFPEKIKFCIDTAHAYSYGYNIADFKAQDQFLELFDEKVGLERVSLIHLNDSCEKVGIHADVHACIGKGKIGDQALRRFLGNEKLKHVAVLTEPPIMGDQELKIEFDKLCDLAK